MESRKKNQEIINQAINQFLVIWSLLKNKLSNQNRKLSNIKFRNLKYLPKSNRKKIGNSSILTTLNLIERKISTTIPMSLKWTIKNQLDQLYPSQKFQNKSIILFQMSLRKMNKFKKLSMQVWARNSQKKWMSLKSSKVRIWCLNLSTVM